MTPILEGRADVVYGSRFLARKNAGGYLWHHYLANRVLTFVSNAFTGLTLTDMAADLHISPAYLSALEHGRQEAHGCPPALATSTVSPSSNPRWPPVTTRSPAASARSRYPPGGRRKR